MKIYTHPTINLPAGAVVVKFYDPAGSGTENTADIIEEIGDVEEGLQFYAEDFYVSDCEFICHDKAGYLSTLLLGLDELIIRVNVNDELYFIGYIDYESLEVDDFGRAISFKAISLIGALRNYLMSSIATDVAAHAWGPSGYNPTRAFFDACLTFLGSSNVVAAGNFFEKRYFERDSGGGSYVQYRFQQLMIDNNYYGTTQWKTLDNAAGIKSSTDGAPRLDNAFQLLNEWCREFFLYIYLVEDGADDFEFLIIEKGYEKKITAPLVETYKRIFKWDIGNIIVDLAGRSQRNMPSVDFLYYSRNLDRKFTDRYKVENRFTNIQRANYTNTTSAGTLTTSGTTINVTSTTTNLFDSSGTAVITHGTTRQEFTYTGKTGSTLTGCTIASGTFDYSTGDIVERSENPQSDAGKYFTNVKLFVQNGAVVGNVDRISNNNGSTYFANYHEANKEFVKDLYYNHYEWAEFEIFGIKATYSASTKLQYLNPFFSFDYNGNEYLIHSVKKSVMRNRSLLTALKIGNAAE